MDEIKIIDFEEEMLGEMMKMFYDTVHTVSAKDYNTEQLERWAPTHPDVVSWHQRLGHNICKVALLNETIAGFAELTDEGHVDTMYVHKDYQRKGIATRLMNELLNIARENGFDELTTEASITARPLFEGFDFKVTRVKTKLHIGEEFINYEMTKAL
jgi:putative acetyltransferase